MAEHSRVASCRPAQLPSMAPVWICHVTGPRRSSATIFLVKTSKFFCLDFYKLFLFKNSKMAQCRILMRVAHNQPKRRYLFTLPKDEEV